MYAGKFYKGRRAKEREAARKEIELMNYLHHPKLVQCLGAYDNKQEMVMVMELWVLAPPYRHRDICLLLLELREENLASCDAI